MVSRMTLQLLTAILLMLCLPVWAATITVTTDRDPVAMNENFRITFKAEGSLDGEPDFSPLNKDFRLLGTSQSSSFSMVNGNISSSKSFTLTVAPLRQGDITIPAISFGRDKSPEKTVKTVAPGSMPHRSRPSVPQASRDLMFVTSEVDNNSPYVQQQVILRVKVHRLRSWKSASMTPPYVDGPEARFQKLGRAANYTKRIGNRVYEVTEETHVFFPQESGELTIAPFQVTARFPAGKQQQRSPFGGLSNDPFFDDFFSRTTYEKRQAQSKPLKITVRPIPKAFTGKHWLPAKDIQLRQTWSTDIDKLQVGEPVTRTVAIIGDGVGTDQLPEISMQESANLKNYPDQPVVDEQISPRGLLSTYTQKLAVIPSQPGAHEIPAIEIPWWNTETDKMEIATLPATRLSAAGDAVPQAPARTDKPVAADQPVAAPDATGPVEPAPVAGRDIDMQTLLLAAVIILALLWLITLVAFFRKKSAPAPAVTSRKQPDDTVQLKAAQQQLHAACQGQQATTVRDALIQWAKAAWPYDPPTNLDDIAARLPGERGTQISNLSKSLYGKGGQDWDAMAIWQAVKDIPVTGDDKPTGSNDSLEPLYR